MDPLRTRFRLVVYGGVRRCVPVVDELRLEGRRRERSEEGEEEEEEDEECGGGIRHRQHEERCLAEEQSEGTSDQRAGSGGHVRVFGRIGGQNKMGSIIDWQYIIKMSKS